MLKNYIKISFRNLKKYKAYSIINISGLSIGIACSLLIFFYVLDELSYDRYHENAKQIYRLAFSEDRSYKVVNYPISSGGMAPAMVKEIPEVLNAVRFMRSFDELVRYQEKQFYEKRAFYADESVFDVFSFSLIEGDAKTALAEPQTAVITEEMAQKYFGSKDPMGEVLTLDNIDFKVTGILKRIPQTSHFKFDLLASMETRKNISEEWRPSSCYTYLLVQRDYPPSELEKKIAEFFLKHKTPRDKRIFYLQPLTKIHLYSHLEREIEPTSDIAYVYILSAVALFVLIIACINFMNLSTARSSNRAKEVGVRKAVGAGRKELIKQFLSESVFLTLIAFLLSLFLLELILPAFNRFSGKELKINIFHSPLGFLGALGFIALVGLMSGSYPAFFISAFQPVKVLQGKWKTGSKSAHFRRILVIFQFSLSILMIAGTLLIRNQLDFIQNRNLGFDKGHVIVIPLDSRQARQNYNTLKNELLKNPAILSVTASTTVPGFSVNPDYVRPEGDLDDEFQFMGSLMVDYDFIKTLGLEIKEGRDFSKDFVSDAREALILNEEAVKKFNWKRAIGKTIELQGLGKKVVIGVVKNFHQLSKYQKIDSYILNLLDRNYLEIIQYILIKIYPGQTRETLSFLKEEWKKLSGGRPLSYQFLDESYDALYRKEEKLNTMFRYFTLFAVFVACLGLFGLASFTAEQRTKEIGIRKVLGASLLNIFILLSKEFTKWVLLANGVAWPVAYYALKKWLQNFAYRTSLDIWIFLLAAVLAFVIALASVSYQALKAALANPVDALRYE